MAGYWQDMQEKAEGLSQPRKPLLTRKEQTLLAFLLALLILGGIVHKLRTGLHMNGPVPVQKS
jgi:hypothetical protein